METSSKKIRGSAIVDDEGLFVFTPYGTQPEAERPQKLVYTSRFCNAWCGRKRASVRIFWGLGGAKPGLSQLFVELTRAWQALRRYQADHPQPAPRRGRKEDAGL